MRIPILLLLACFIGAQAQNPAAPAAATPAATPKKISLTISILDKKWKAALVRAEDLQVLWDGKPIAIAGFVPEPPNGKDLALLMDTSGSTRDKRHTLNSVAQDTYDLYTKNGKREVLLVLFSDLLEAQQITSKSKLRDSLAHTSSGGETHLYDAVYFAASKFKDPVADGPRAIIVFTDGVDHGSVVPVDEVVRKAVQARTTVNIIKLVGDSSEDKQRNTLAALDGLTSATGGFLAVFDSPFDDFLKLPKQVLAGQYLLTVELPTAVSSGFHRFSVTTKDRGLRVFVPNSCHVSN